MKEKIEEIRRMYPNCILLVRGKECYYMYEEDAKEASKILGLITTKSEKFGLLQTCFYAKELKDYLHKLIKAGKRVLICNIFVQEYYNI